MYEETEEIDSFFFIKKGVLAFVLTAHENAVYKWIKRGTIVGFEDYPYYLLGNGLTYDELRTIELNPSKVKREFSLIAKTVVEALELPIEDIVKMAHDFPHVLKLIYHSSENRVLKML